jgi:hypothetical protein
MIEIKKRFNVKKVREFIAVSDKPDEFIRGWIGGWRDSCDEFGYEIIADGSDYKKFAYIVIKKPDGNIQIKLSVKKVKNFV